jgi:NADH:ubiquinone oxidoreductase subunit 2 (subunit N)
MSYLELLKLVSPEAIVAVTVLAVLAIGLTIGRASDFCSAVAALGLALAVGAVLILPQNATLFGGMLVISPLTSLFKIICIALAFFTVLLASGDRSSPNPGEYLEFLLLA